MHSLPKLENQTQPRFISGSQMKKQKKDVEEAANAVRDVAERVVATATEPVEAAISRAVGGLRQFAEVEASGGIALVIAAVLALIVSNSGMADAYQVSQG